MISTSCNLQQQLPGTLREVMSHTTKTVSHEGPVLFSLPPPPPPTQYGDIDWPRHSNVTHGLVASLSPLAASTRTGLLSPISASIPPLRSSHPWPRWHLIPRRDTRAHERGKQCRTKFEIPHGTTRPAHEHPGNSLRDKGKVVCEHARSSARFAPQPKGLPDVW